MSLMPPIRGDIMTFGMSQSGLSSGNGSTAKTSSPAPAIFPSRSAAIIAPSSMTPPRAMLMMKADCFIAAKTRPSMRCRVVSSSGVRAIRKSAMPAASVNRARGRIRSNPGVSARALLTPTTFMPNALQRAAISSLMTPTPTMTTVLLTRTGCSARFQT